MKKIIALALVFGITSLFAAEAGMDAEMKSDVKTEKAAPAKKAPAKKSSKKAHAKKAQKKTHAKKAEAKKVPVAKTPEEIQ